MKIKVLNKTSHVFVDAEKIGASYGYVMKFEVPANGVIDTSILPETDNSTFMVNVFLPHYQSPEHAGANALWQKLSA